MGKQIVREPKIYGHVEPTVTFHLTQDTMLEADVGYEFTGRPLVGRSFSVVIGRQW